MATSTVIPTDSKRVIEVIETCRSRKAVALSDLPFYIRVTNIMVPSFTPLNPPPIGLAIIGINNYIL